MVLSVVVLSVVVVDAGLRSGAGEAEAGAFRAGCERFSIAYIHKYTEFGIRDNVPNTDTFFFWY
jgi:hypothetical protein